MLAKSDDMKTFYGSNNSVVQWDEYIAKNKKQTCMCLSDLLSFSFAFTYNSISDDRIEHLPVFKPKSTHVFTE